MVIIFQKQDCVHEYKKETPANINYHSFQSFQQFLFISKRQISISYIPLIFRTHLLIALADRNSKT